MGNLMDGVQILDCTIKSSANTGDLIIGIILIIMAIICFFCTICGFSEEEFGAGISCFFGFLFFVFLGGIILNGYLDKYDYGEYKVMISDDVKMNEFTSKFDIVKTEGKIYTVIKKSID